MDCSLPGSSVRGIIQARILEWVAISFSRGSSQPRNRTWVSCIAGRFFTDWATLAPEIKQTFVSTNLACLLTFEWPAAGPHTFFWLHFHYTVTTFNSHEKQFFKRVIAKKKKKFCIQILTLSVTFPSWWNTAASLLHLNFHCPLWLSWVRVSFPCPMGSGPSMCCTGQWNP